MATMRRLSDHDVRAIYEYIHNENAPLPKQDFRIVSVGPTGQKLSPPSYEFENGLYVLLTPQRKKDKCPDYSKVPPHLKHLIMRQPLPESCPWSLSGPQFPKPTAIQQRYCYPRGKAEYSNRKGGALWTMYNTQGKEDVEYRLLHVYFSNKRAANKGVAPAGAVSDDSYSPPAAKRSKRSATRGTRTTKARNQRRTPHRTPRATRGSFPIHQPSPAITASTDGSCHSPTSVGTLPPPSVQFSPPTHLNIAQGMHNARGQQRLVDKSSMPPLTNNHSLITFENMDCDDAFDARTIHPVGSHEMSSPYGDTFATGPSAIYFPPTYGNYPGMPYGPGMPPLQQPAKDLHMASKQSSQPVYPHQQLNHSMMMHHSDQDLHDICVNDPLFSIPSQRSMDFMSSTLAVPTDKIATENFATHLETLHKRFREMIHAAPSGDKAAMVSTLTQWGQHVAKEPLGNISNDSEQKAAATTNVKKEA